MATFTHNCILLFPPEAEISSYLTRNLQTNETNITDKIIEKVANIFARKALYPMVVNLRVDLALCSLRINSADPAYSMLVRNLKQALLDCAHAIPYQGDRDFDFVSMPIR